MELGDYHSEFDSEAEPPSKVSRRERKKDDAHIKLSGVNVGVNKASASRAHHSFALSEFDKAEHLRHREHFLALDAYQRHKKLVNDYILYYGGDASQMGRSSAFDKTDMDVVRENMNFLYEPQSAEDDNQLSWEKKVAKRYWNKLNKEYTIADLCLYREGKIGLRWRTELEVVSGKGHFVCGNKRCEDKDDLRSWEINFAYKEEGERKNALVKIRLCPDCSVKLNFKKQHNLSIKKPPKMLAIEDKSSPDKSIDESEKTKSKKQKKEKKPKKEHKKHHNRSHSSKKEKKKRHRKRSTSRDSAGSRKRASDSDGSDSDQSEKEDLAAEIWANDVIQTTADEEKTAEEEMEDYFKDMFT